jgi:uncharacterized Rmd1/YagE family protein
VVLIDLTPEALIVIADAISKSVVRARNEREVATALDLIEPLARETAEHGRTFGSRRAILKQIGNALLAQHRVSGRADVTEKPEVVWERPDLDRLYGRLENEFELKERATILARKLAVISDTAGVLSDIINTRRALRLEFIIVLLIAAEIDLVSISICCAKAEASAVKERRRTKCHRNDPINLTRHPKEAFQR